MAKTTASASGMNSDAAGPVRNTTGTNTMQMASVETNAGTAICAAPSRIARRSGFFMPRLRWMFSISTVASSTRMPTASAMPPSVMMLSDWPSAHRTMIDDQDRQRDRDGDDERAPPRAEEQQDHQRRQPGGDGPFLEHAFDGGPHEHRLVEEQLDLQLGRQLGLDAGQGGADAVDHVEGGGPFALEDGHQHRPPAVAADDVGLHRVAHRARGPRP